MSHRAIAQGGRANSGRLLIWSCFVAISGFVLWADWAEIDQITRASGQGISSARNQVIQSPEGGVMRDLMVREGARVKQGQVLFRLDKNKAEAAYLESAAKAAALKAAVARLQAEMLGGQPQFPAELSRYPDFQSNQQQLFNKRQSAVHDELAALRKSMAMVKVELDMNLPLLQTGDVSRSDILKLQRQVSDIEGQMTNRHNKYLQDTQTDYAKAQEDLASALQVLAQRKEQLDYTESRAPMDGVVRNVRITTRGGVARAGEEIMQIVPLEDDFLIEAKVKPADAAFVKPGLPATVKLDAYDYTVYGPLRGQVTYISADTFSEDNRNNESPYYRVQIKTNGRSLVGKNGEQIAVQPGMTASVEIKTGSTTVLRYLTKPIFKTVTESMRER
jgi:adhesin transport system membrane fusion protein